MIHAIAIDDEPKAISVIASHISKMDDVKLINKFHDPVKALLFLKQNPVDLIFLDINMPYLNGIDLIEKLEIQPLVIFTTAYDEYALKSYNLNAVDYLLKPFEYERFKIAIKKAEERLNLKRKQSEFFFIKDGFTTHKIMINAILFIKGSGNYLDIITPNKTFSPRMTFTEIINKLPTDTFIRTHQSYLLNSIHIDKIENNQIYVSDHKIPISNKYKEMLYRRLGLQ